MRPHGPVEDDRSSLRAEPESADPTRVGVVTGRVVSREDGAPLGDAKVRAILQLPGDGSRRGGTTSGTLSARTDERGLFRLTGLANAPYVLYASCPGHLDERCDRVFPGRELELRLRRDTGIACRVELDLSAGMGHAVHMYDGQEPLPRQKVLLWTRSQDWDLEAETDEQGVFLVTGIAAEDFEERRRQGRVRALAPGYAGSTLTRVEGERHAYLLRLRKGATLFGRVVDKTSRMPIPGATVVCESGHSVTTDREGSYVMSGVEEGVTVFAPGYAAQTVTLDYTGGAQAQLNQTDFLLEKGLSLYGRVVDPEHEPVRGIRVGIATHVSDLTIDGDRVQRERLESLSSTTDEEGRYRLEGLVPDLLEPPGTLWVELRPPGSLGGILEEVEVPAGETSLEKDFVIELAQSVSGRLRDDAGGPIADGCVFVDGRDDRVFQMAATDVGGEFELVNLPWGEYQLGVEIEGRPVLIDRISVPSEHLELEVSEGRNVRGSVYRSTDGTPIAGLEVRLVFFKRFLELSRETRTDEWGTFSFEGVPDAECSLELRAPSRLLPFGSMTPYHMVRVDTAIGDWFGEVEYPCFSGGQISLEFFLADDGGTLRIPEGPVEVQAVYSRREGPRRAGAGEKGRRFPLGSARGRFERSLREGSYTFYCTLSLEGQRWQEELTVNLIGGETQQREVIFAVR